MRDAETSFDVVVIGAGPGGIAAAVTAAEAGRRVCLIDDSPLPGGQIWRHRAGDSLPRSATRWLNRLTAAPVVRLGSTRLVATPSAGSLLIETPEASPRSRPAGALFDSAHECPRGATAAREKCGVVMQPALLRWQSLILATGARELFLPFPGWTLPGVVGAGGLQALVKQGLPVKGKRIVLAGSGPLLFAVASLMKSKGAIVPLILEQASRSRINRFAFGLLGSPNKLLQAVAIRSKLFQTRYAMDSYPLTVTRGPSSLSVAYRDGDRDRSIDCDYLGCGFNLIPNDEVARLLGCELSDGFVKTDRHCRTTVDHVYAVGELSGVGGVDKAIIEGQIAAHAVVDNLSAAERLAPAHAAALDFVRRLNSAFALRPELRKLAQPQTIVCRCEDTALAEVQCTIGSRDAKLQTRCGMGPCQGRVCGPILQQLFNAEPPQLRPPLFPTKLQTLAALSQ